MSPFQKILCKFLATNTLQTVCPWVEDVVAQEISSVLFDRSRASFVYCPPPFTVNARPLSTFVHPNPDTRAVERVFRVPIGFFWETVETGDECFPDPMPSDDGSNVEAGIQTTMSLISNGLFCNGKATMAILSRTLQINLSIAGVRLLYPTAEQIGNFPLKFPPCCQGLPPKAKFAGDSVPVIGPVLAIALRGASARSMWLDVVGPCDPVIARRINSNSLCALYGGNSRDSCLLYCPRSPQQTTAEVVRWFGGRVPENRVISVGESLSRPTVSSKSRKSHSSAAGENRVTVPPHSIQAAMLCAMTYSDIFLAISPLIPSHCLALVLCIAQQRGYKICGIRRIHLSSKRASHLGK